MNKELEHTLVDLIKQHACELPDKLAYIMLNDRGDEIDRITFAELDIIAKAQATKISESCAKGERVLMLYPSGLEFVQAFISCQYAGVVAVPASLPSRRGEHHTRITHIIQDAEISTILTDSASWPALKDWLDEAGMSGLRVIISDTVDPAMENRYKPVTVTRDDLSFLQYTSGSTGSPKGVMISHGNLIHNSELIRDRMHHSQDMVSCSWLPFYHDMGLIGNILQSVHNGSTLVLLSPTSFLKRPATWLKAISHYRAYTSGAPNFGYEYCLSRIKDEDLQGIDLSHWQNCFNGAEPVRQDTIELFFHRFKKFGFRYSAMYPCYGMAETTLFVSGGQSGEAHQTICVAPESYQNKIIEQCPPGTQDAMTCVSCGTFEGLNVAIVEPESQARLPHGRIGEIWVHGDSVGQGYWNQPEKNAHTFQALIANSDDERRWLRTGDLGFITNGELFISGRLKDLIVVNGRNLYPQDIEIFVSGLDPRLEKGFAAAFAVEGSLSEEIVIVQEIATNDTPEAEFPALSHKIRAAITLEFQAPIQAVVLIKRGTICRTTSGKIQRNQTRQKWQAEPNWPLFDDSITSATYAA
ncbi:acyl-CoA synthetase (AMP-forming)/AMP-acid ligase II [Shewanella psychrophila]|uniref:Acyl-CoA synthetase (AMP-forming)/AMP-acid ligase II n=1 Tax=Shewanella psychrophila TaxID=225848 RepID=A0A1S6HIX8_9GAMM|nr:fatty acyl-AMP ligase [Shewanella psychrophila]AQS35444.1 acyl-CoA synthetase (AMP-forming)/AMP-acid ligase II [Shewanella psychrophila]